MSTAVLIVNRAFSSDFDSLYRQTCYLDGRYDKIILVHNYKTDKILGSIRCKIDETIKIDDHTSAIYDQCKFTTWGEYYDWIDLSVVKDHVDDIWFFGGTLSEGGRFLRKHKDTLDRCLDKRHHMRFISLVKYYVYSYFALKLAKRDNAQIHELSYDPGEYSLSFVNDDRIRPMKFPIVYHGYDVDHLGMKKLTSFQNSLQYTNKSFFFDGEYDFVFGYSYITKDRKSTHEIVQELHNTIKTEFSCELFVKNKIDNINTFVDYDTYLDYVSASRFTLIMPAYQEKCFSIYRFIESLYLDCLPLIHETCFIEEVEKSYDVDLSTLVISNDNISSVMRMPEEARLEKIAYLKDKFLL